MVQPRVSFAVKSDMMELTDNVAVETTGAIDADPELDGAVFTPTRFRLADYWLILLLGSMSGLGPLAIDMYLPSFPAIAREMGSTTAVIERTMAAYFAGLAIGQLFYGPLADRVGRKVPLYTGLSLFILASLGCSMTHSVPALIVLRFVQALGGCAEMVMARAIVRDRFDGRDAARVFSALMLVMGLAPVLAPMVGGWLVAHGSWRIIFAVQATAGAACLAAVFFGLPESLPAEKREKRSAKEIIVVYGQLLRHRVLMSHTLSASLLMAGLFAYVAGSPFIFLQLFKVPPQHFWWFFGTNAAGLIGSSQVNGWLVQRAEPSKILRGGLIVATLAGLAYVGTASSGFGGFVGVEIPLFVSLCCFGFVVPTATALAMAPHGRVAGNASAVLGSIQFFVSGLGGMAVSLLHNGTAVPMAGIIAVSAAAALGVNLAFSRE